MHYGFNHISLHQANDGGDDSDSETESGVIDEVEVMDTTDNAAQAVRGLSCCHDVGSQYCS